MCNLSLPIYIMPEDENFEINHSYVGLQQGYLE